MACEHGPYRVVEERRFIDGSKTGWWIGCCAQCGDHVCTYLWPRQPWAAPKRRAT